MVVVHLENNREVKMEFMTDIKKIKTCKYLVSQE